MFGTSGVGNAAYDSEGSVKITKRKKKAYTRVWLAFDIIVNERKEARTIKGHTF